jgi:hypothetical protein
MDLQNGYKVIYEKAADGKRTFYASKSGVFADAEKIAETAIGQYKLVYEKAGQIYGSESGIPAEGDHCFTEFDMVFKAAEDEVAETAGEPTNEDTPVEIPEDEPTIEDPTEEEGEF